MDSTALKSEITTDPQSLGYASPVAAGNDQAICDLLNATSGPGAATLTLTTIAKNDFLKITSAANVRLALNVGTDGQPFGATVATKWIAAIEQARAADPGSQIDLSVIPALGDPVADRVTSTAELALLTTRLGSRAEVLFGAGTVVGQSDVSFALRGNR